MVPNVNATALLDAAPDAIVVVDVDGAILLVNARAETLFGYARQELLGSAIETLLPARHHTDHVAHRARFASSPRPRAMGTDLQLFARHKDGREFPVEVSLSPLHTAEGLLISTAIRDASERKSAEAALITARAEAERANRLKSAFVAAASHDLRQPLQTLALLNAVLAKTAAPGTQAADVALAQARAIQTMSDLLTSLLDISKLEAGAVRPHVQNCMLAPIVDRIAEQFAAPAAAKGIELRVDHCDTTVRTDPALLQQILQNLVDNAVRHTHHGHVYVGCSSSEDVIRLTVCDTGPGIPPQEREMIFSDFYQIEGGSNREGLGLGLSIVRRLAELLGHRIEVESNLGSGSSFAVELPKGQRTRRLRAEAPPDVGDGPHQERSGKMLVIDDDAAVAQATAMLLEVAGHEAKVAATVAEACALVRGERYVPDVLVCDLHLRGESGIDAIVAVRASAGFTVPAVLVTGDTSAEVTDLLHRAAPCHPLKKPIDGDALLALLDAVMRGSHRHS